MVIKSHVCSIKRSDKSISGSSYDGYGTRVAPWLRIPKIQLLAVFVDEKTTLN